MPIKPPNYSYGSGGGALLGLIAQAMANKYRETPTQMGIRQRGEQRRSQKFQAEQAELAAEERALGQLRAFDLGMQEAIARGQVLTPETAQSDPALRGRDIRTRSVSILGLPGLEGIDPSRLGARTSYRVLDPEAVRQRRLDYNPFEGSGPVPVTDLQPRHIEYLNLNPNLYNDLVAASEADISTTLSGIQRLAGVSPELLPVAQELEQRVAEGPIDYATLIDYGKRADIELQARQQERADTQLALNQAQYGLLRDQWAAARAKDVERFMRLIPDNQAEAFYSGEAPEVVVDVPQDVARALRDIAIEAEELDRDETESLIRLRQADLGREDYDLADLYFNHSLMLEDPSRYLTTGGGFSSLPSFNIDYAPWRTQIKEDFEDWSRTGRGGTWLVELARKLREDPSGTYALLRSYAPGILPADQAELSHQQLLRAVENDPSQILQAAFMGANNAILGFSRADLPKVLRFAELNPYANFTYIPDPESLELMRRILKVDNKLQAWGEDADKWFDQMISRSVGLQTETRGPGGSIDPEALEEARAETEASAGSGLGDLGGNQQALQSHIQDMVVRGQIAQGWLKTQDDSWTQPQQSAFSLAKNYEFLRNINEETAAEFGIDPATAEMYKEALEIISESSSQDLEDVSGALQNMLKYLPQESQSTREWVSKALDIYNRTGRMDYLEVQLKPAVAIALQMMRGNTMDPVIGENRYRINLRRDAEASSRSYGGAAPLEARIF